jgi:PPM family protein phosphatase
MMTMWSWPIPAEYIIVLALIAMFGLLSYVRHLLVQHASSNRLRIGNGQTIGQREEQDDYFSTVSTSMGTIAVLADGISGLANGRIASTIAVQTFIEEFQRWNGAQQMEDFFRRTARLANSSIIQSLKGGRGGTTLVAAIVSDGMLYWGSVGDSSLTVFRDGEFMTINEKHTLENELERRYVSGEITRHEVVSNPLKHQLTNYLGHDGFKEIEVCLRPFALKKKDQVILASDGVYNTLSELELERILISRRTPHDAAEAIIEAVDRKGLKNQDNATVVIMDKGW